MSFFCLKILCWFPVVLSLRPSYHRGGEGPSSCLKQPAATSFTYVSYLQASSLQCDPPSPKQSLSTLPHYSYQKPGLELSSGPARPLREGSAASWKKLWICSQVCWEKPGRFLYKGDQNNGVFEFYTGQILSPDRHSYSWDVSQQDGVDTMLSVCPF